VKGKKFCCTNGWTKKIETNKREGKGVKNEGRNKVCATVADKAGAGGKKGDATRDLGRLERVGAYCPFWQLQVERNTGKEGKEKKDPSWSRKATSAKTGCVQRNETQDVAVASEKETKKHKTWS